MLFADLSGFTSLSERLDPELIRTFQNDPFTEMAGAVYQYEGFVEKFVGDEIMGATRKDYCNDRKIYHDRVCER